MCSPTRKRVPNADGMNWNDRDRCLQGRVDADIVLSPTPQRDQSGLMIENLLDCAAKTYIPMGAIPVDPNMESFRIPWEIVHERYGADSNSSKRAS